MEGYCVIGTLCSIVGCELRRWDASATAVRSDFVVVAPPVSDRFTGLCQRREPVLVQTLIAELAVEAFDVTVLHGPARLDQQVLDPVLLRPGDERAAGELRTVVGTHRTGIAVDGLYSFTWYDSVGAGHNIGRPLCMRADLSSA